jgi:hypothetical protein
MESKELGLHVERQVTDLVKKQRAPRSRPYEALLIADGAGEAAPAVTEQLAVREVAAAWWSELCTGGTEPSVLAGWTRCEIARATRSLPSSALTHPWMRTVRL